MYSRWGFCTPMENCTLLHMLPLLYSITERYIGATPVCIKYLLEHYQYRAFSNSWPFQALVWGCCYGPPLGGWRGGSSPGVENWKWKSAWQWRLLRCWYHLHSIYIQPATKKREPSGTKFAVNKHLKVKNHFILHV
jgi:hypothetical protein